MTPYELTQITEKARLLKVELCPIVERDASTISRWFRGLVKIPTRHFIEKMISFLQERRRNDWEMIRALKIRQNRALKKAKTPS
jgi:hypothetical protein